MLTLREEILLLGLRDDRGSAEGSNYTRVRCGLAGAALAELYLQGRLGSKPGSIWDHVHRRVTVVDIAPIGDKVLDEALTRIRQSKREKRAFTWLKKFSGTALGDPLNETAASLVDKGIVARQEGKAALVFHRTYYPTLDPSAEQAVRDRLRSVLLAGEAPDAPTLALIALMRGCGYLRYVFDGQELRTASHAAKDLLKTDRHDESVEEMLREIDNAVSATIDYHETPATAGIT